MPHVVKAGSQIKIDDAGFSIIVDIVTKDPLTVSSERV
jgi:hypothetical protein